MTEDLFTYQPPKAFARASDPATSHDAARSIDEALPLLEGLVLSAVRGAGASGMTLDDLIDVLHLDKVTISPRLRPLCDKGLVMGCGKRPGKSGRGQTIWVTASCPSIQGPVCKTG